jgi:hypothetical protein
MTASGGGVRIANRAHRCPDRTSFVNLLQLTALIKWLDP